LNEKAPESVAELYVRGAINGPEDGAKLVKALVNFTSLTSLDVSCE